MSIDTSAPAPAVPRRLKVAIIGDRGIPARYSGFSTLVEEISTRLVAEHGFDVTVYARRPYYDTHPPEHRGVRIVWLPSPGGKSLESILHSNLSIAHAAFLRRYDLVFVVDPGNGPFCLPLKLVRTPVLYHTDGLGWKRTKWSPMQRRYYKWAERVTAALADWMVTDSDAMVDYYRREYGAENSFIPYGSIVGGAPVDSAPAELGLEPGGYHLVCARLEPENNTDLIVDEFLRSKARLPLVVVGGVPYKSAYADALKAKACSRLIFVGSVFDSGRFNGLMRHCRVYLHGHEVGGTNPSLLRAMGAGAFCLPLDAPFNLEVVGEGEPSFSRTPGHLATRLEYFESADADREAACRRTLARSREHYRWDAVGAAYADMFRAMIAERRAGRSCAGLRGRAFYRPEGFGPGFEDWPSAETAALVA